MMDIFFSAELAVPLYQILLLLILSTTTLLLGRVKIALLINYLFALYWGYFFNRDLFEGYLEGAYYFHLIYFGLGVFISIIAVIGFIRQRHF